MKLDSLILLRNDPVAAAEIIEHALAGDKDAQFAAGLIYAEGRGVIEDKVQAFFWFSQAIEQGDQDAIRLRNIIGSQMTDQEYASARKLLTKAAKTNLISTKPNDRKRGRKIH